MINPHSALHLAANQVMDIIVKHIDLMYHFIRQAVFDNRIELVGILKLADVFLKVIPLEIFSYHCARMQVMYGE